MQLNTQGKEYGIPELPCNAAKVNESIYCLLECLRGPSDNKHAGSPVLSLVRRLLGK